MWDEVKTSRGTEGLTGPKLCVNGYIIFYLHFFFFNLLQADLCDASWDIKRSINRGVLT